MFIKKYYLNKNIICFHRIDDIEDSSELRRGIPVAHKIYGVPRLAFHFSFLIVIDFIWTFDKYFYFVQNEYCRTLNAANYVYFLALEKTLALGHPDATTVFTGWLMMDKLDIGHKWLSWNTKLSSLSTNQHTHLLSCRIQSQPVP